MWICPSCGSTNISDNPTGGEGSIYCNDCGYWGMHGHPKDDYEHCESCYKSGYSCPCGCTNKEEEE